MTTLDKKSDIYRRIKIAGLLSILPFVLAAGPFGGYLLGDYLEKSFRAPAYVPIACIVLGFLGSLMEAVRIIKAALKTEGK